MDDDDDDDLGLGVAQSNPLGSRRLKYGFDVLEQENHSHDVD